MAFGTQPVGATFRVAVQGRWDDAVDVVNVYALNNTGSAISDEQNLIEDMIDWATALLTILKYVQNLVMIWDSIHISAWEGEWTLGTNPLAAPIAGTNDNGAAASGVAALMYFNTSTPRRQARKYFGGLDADVLVGESAQLTSAALTALSTLGVFLLDEYVGSYSTYQYGVYQIDGTPAFLLPNSGVVSATPAYQRRRRRGTGS
jgi:hypothetical protein